MCFCRKCGRLRAGIKFAHCVCPAVPVVFAPAGQLGLKKTNLRLKFTVSFSCPV